MYLNFFFTNDTPNVIIYFIAKNITSTDQKQIKGKLLVHQFFNPLIIRTTLCPKLTSYSYQISP